MLGYDLKAGCYLLLLSHPVLTQPLIFACRLIEKRTADPQEAAGTRLNGPHFSKVFLFFCLAPFCFFCFFGTEWSRCCDTDLISERVYETQR